MVGLIFNHIDTFNFEDLDGKTLKIVVNKLEDVTLVYGYDEQNKEIYVISESITR